MESCEVVDAKAIVAFALVPKSVWMETLTPLERVITSLTYDGLRLDDQRISYDSGFRKC